VKCSSIGRLLQGRWASRNRRIVPSSSGRRNPPGLRRTPPLPGLRGGRGRERGEPAREWRSAAPPSGGGLRSVDARRLGLQLWPAPERSRARAEVPVILRAEQEDPSSRVWRHTPGRLRSSPRIAWATYARAAAATNRPASDDSSSSDERRYGCARAHRGAPERALFDSVIAGKCARSRAHAPSIALFDSLSQLLAQLVTYRWMALLTTKSGELAIHAPSTLRESAEAEVRAALSVRARERWRMPRCRRGRRGSARRTVVLDVLSAGPRRQVASASPAASRRSDAVAPVAARELGGPIRLAILVEESQRLATTDGRRASSTGAPSRDHDRELSRCDRCSTSASLLLLDSTTSR